MNAAVRRALIVFVIVMAGMAPFGAANARVVGVVFDDSGSMVQNIQLPTFGMQLLVATLDGRNDRDRLLTARLSDFMRAFDIVSIADQGGTGQTRVPQLPVPLEDVGPGTIPQIMAAARHQPPLIQRWAIADQDQLASAIDRIATEWPHATSHTPYAPVEVMLQTLVEETKAGEDAFLVIVSDGAFYDGARLLPPDVRGNFRKYKEKLKGTLTVFFLLTLNAPETRQEVERQGVRRALLDTFEGKSFEVASFEGLRDAMLEIIARISAIDPGLGSAAVQRTHSEIDLDLPFTVTRIISIAQGEAGTTIPALSTTPFPVGRRINLSPEMRAADNQHLGKKIPGWPTTRLRAEVTQFEPVPPLAPGHYQLTYTAPVGEVVRLLFRSDVYLAVDVVGPDHRPVAGNGDGRLKLITDTQYELQIRVLERVDGREQDVPLDRLPAGAIATVTLESQGTTRTEQPARDKARGRFVLPLELAAEGETVVKAGLRLPGLLATKTVGLLLEAEKRDVRFTIGLERLAACPGCAENVVPFTFSPAVAPVALARLPITADAKPGKLFARLGGQSNGLVLLGPSGQPIESEDAVAFEPGKPIFLTLGYGPEWRPEIRDGRYQAVEIALAVTAAAPLRGGATRSFVLNPQPRAVQLRYVGHTQDPRGASRPVLGLEDLAAGALAVDFVLDGAQASEGDFTSRIALPLSVVRSTVFGERLAAFPELAILWRWLGCDCPVGLLFSGEHRLSATWRSADGVLEASADAAIDFKPRPEELVAACLWFAVVILGIIWVVGLSLTILRACRFPANSRLVVSEPGYDLPRSEKLRGAMSRHFGRCALWFVPGWRADEWRRVEGLTWIATSSGASLKAMRAWPPFLVRDLGQPIEEIAKMRGKDEGIDLPWGGVLQEQAKPGRRLELVEDYRRIG